VDQASAGRFLRQKSPQRVCASALQPKTLGPSSLGSPSFPSILNRRADIRSPRLITGETGSDLARHGLEIGSLWRIPQGNKRGREPAPDSTEAAAQGCDPSPSRSRLLAMWMPENLG
jgi:hypothetical protein